MKKLLFVGFVLLAVQFSLQPIWASSDKSDIPILSEEKSKTNLGLTSFWDAVEDYHNNCKLSKEAYPTPLSKALTIASFDCSSCTSLSVQAYQHCVENNISSVCGCVIVAYNSCVYNCGPCQSCITTWEKAWSSQNCLNRKL